MRSIIEFRNRHSLTQQELAVILGVKQNTVSMYENGKRVLSPDRAQKLVKAAEQLGEELTLNEIYML